MARTHAWPVTIDRLLLLVFLAMLAWAVLGSIENVTGLALVVPLQNPDFPAGTQFIHWVLAVSSSATFVFGYALRWQRTPIVMVVLFAMLTTLCFIETFDFMTSDSRYLALALECAAYILIGAYLLNSDRLGSRFASET
jgi:hypothetical protein